jgi:hypothetical protein
MILRTLLDIVISDPTKNSADFLLSAAQRQHESFAESAARRDSQET